MILAFLPMGDFLSWTFIMAIAGGLGVLLIVGAIWSVQRVLGNTGDTSMKGMTTFITVLVGMIILLVMFYLLMEEFGKPRFDDALKAAALIIAPLGTFIGFVAGQSAGSAGVERAVKIAEVGQQAGAQAASVVDQRFEQLLAAERDRAEERNLTVQVMAGMMSKADAEEALEKVRKLRSN